MAYEAAAGGGAAQTLEVGYNVSKAEEMNNNIITKYNSIGEFIQTQWPNVVSTLQNNWIGPDEQSFEGEFANKINTLYVNAFNLAKTCTDNIVTLCNSWIAFQKSNTLEGAEQITGLSDVDFMTPDEPTANLVSKKARTFTAGMSLGLAADNSAQLIKDSIKSYADEIDSKTKDFYKSIDPSSSFFGTQTESIKEYIAAVGDAIANLLTNVEDLYGTVDQLAGTHYTTAASDVAAQMKSGAQTISEGLASYNDRWGNTSVQEK